MEDYIVFGKPDIQEAEIAEVIDSLKSCWLGTGPKVQRFEKDFSGYKGMPQGSVAALNSCTAALHLSLLAAGVGLGDEVITTGLTFCATVNSIVNTGATPVVVDVALPHYNIDPELIRKSITGSTKAVVVVHYAGVSCEMTEIKNLCDEFGLVLIEDCAHAIEGYYEGSPLGMIGDYSCFSFYATKNITTGEGGMIYSRDPQSLERIKTLSLHGMSADAWGRFSDDGYNHYHVTEPGFKYNMMDLQAAVGIHQLARIDSAWEKRRECYEFYQMELKGLPVSLPRHHEYHSKVSYHLFPILIEKGASLSRDQLMLKLHERGIGTGVHYQSIMSQPYYKSRFSGVYQTPIADDFGNRTISLPFSASLSEGERSRVVIALNELLNS
ncbi:DegT/DnrJ/EryC1/StrS family aminotransferase [Pseudoteredinibacter isoporae]|uniref:dTDP-4-amino-4,6-dideoxygalactose transaminase n=1 Tax=Pseudoteredinibacter isoporae TaxID=570281 RepID=A0A7X0MY55_9GAMM|nr:DegT/DnrJ/EryC1/StrS family aminotransferase [Pseudoteredinibacter isoporae]MBB6522709.1 dTDP-4-amino-4,6-dideoxygalactose transaminase [Pseudoteredinibacter isoporae]NHO88239.1 DegT/DnrJ/EryC1/StrS family aminotransferase [Pseudoteredinibacter isoporae]NIB23430.1 DegT/DnrJ/EryC1/StrS family aminotransferase [Pseudoteredinibacter isoporae]